MDGDLLRMLFEINHYALKANLAGLTHEDSLLSPDPGGNCINWVLGHIVASRNRVLALVGDGPLWSEERASRFRRGSAPVTDPSNAEPLEAMVADLDRSQERIMAGLARMSDDDLARPGDGGTVAEQLAQLQFHEAYHAGQIGLLRRIAGKEGAIR